MSTAHKLLALRPALWQYLDTMSEDRRDILSRLAQAISEWGCDMEDTIVEATRMGLYDCGLWRCEICGCILLDPALSGVGDTEHTHMLGDYIICGDCYETDRGRAIRHQVEDYRHWAHGYASECGGGSLHRYITEKCEQLARSDRGLKAMSALRRFIIDNYIGLDERNQDAVCALLITASNSPISTLDALEVYLGPGSAGERKE